MSPGNAPHTPVSNWKHIPDQQLIAIVPYFKVAIAAWTLSLSREGCTTREQLQIRVRVSVRARARVKKAKGGTMMRCFIVMIYCV